MADNSSQKFLLLVNQHTVPIFKDVANALSSSGYKVILFTGCIEKGGKELSADIRIIKSIRYRRKTSVLRVCTWLAFSIHYFFFLWRWRKPHAVLAVSNPPFAPLITGLVAGIRKFSYFVLVYDLYPDAMVQAGFLKKEYSLYRLWARANRHVFERALKIFTLSDSMKRAAANYTKGNTSNISVIYNWADTEYIRPMPKNENKFITKYDLQGKTIVLYSGNMGLTHDLESLVDAAEILKDKRKLFFIFIGDGAKKNALVKKVQSKYLTNTMFLPYQNAVDFPMAMAAADVGIVTLGSGAEGISVPSKTYINLAAGLCVLAIAPKDSELSRLINAHQVGVICEPNNAHQVALRLSEIASNAHLLEMYKEKALNASLSFTSQNAFKYKDEICSVI